ncbi:MAG: DUF72 domain-containing protein [Caulobacteraceae bacterium]
MTDLRIGCSGWSYKDWRGPFYPPEVKAKDQLAWYARRFSTTEINASFYRLPTEKAVAAWRDAVPEGFLFAWKASRFLTHNKELKDPEESLNLILGRMEGLQDRYGPILFQLPPSLRLDRERLAHFLALLPRQRRCTVEFRHASWYAPEIFRLLAEHDVALCVSDHHDAPSPWEATASFVYIRAHGPGGRFRGRYSEAELKSLAHAVKEWRRDGKAVFCYFDNDIKSAAPQDAEQLIALCGNR